MGLSQHLRRYGHLVYHLDFAEPTPGEQPDAVVAAVDAYRVGRAADPGTRRRQLEERSSAAARAAHEALRRRPLRRAMFNAALRWSRHWNAARDEALYAFTLPWPAIRRAYLELGRRLADAGALPSAADVFFLTGDEVRSWCASPGVDTRGWAGLAARRREERERRRLLTPPAFVPEDTRVVLGPWDITDLALVGADRNRGEKHDLRGSGVSSGPHPRLVVRVDQGGGRRHRRGRFAVARFDRGSRARPPRGHGDRQRNQGAERGAGGGRGRCSRHRPGGGAFGGWQMTAPATPPTGHRQRRWARSGHVRGCLSIRGSRFRMVVRRVGAASVSGWPMVKAYRIIAEYAGRLYYPLHAVPSRRRLMITPRLLLVEYLVYRVDAVLERNRDNDLELTRASDYGRLHRYKALFRILLRLLGAWSVTLTARGARPWPLAQWPDQ